MDDSLQAVESIFVEALAKTDPQQRRVYLDEICGQNAELRARVERLLQAHERAASFLEEQASGLVEAEATLDINPAAMDAGLARTFGANDAVVLGGAGHSVLKALGKKLGNLPKVTLKESPDERSSAVRPRSPQLPTDTADSRYQIHGEIARGGMGAIIKGRDIDLGRDLAIKVLLDSHKSNPDVIQRFVEEAQIGGQLQHPGIAPVYELGQFSDERPFFTMKLVKGETLAAILSRRSSPSDELPKLLGIFEQMCQTMAYAHSKGVIHRDLKPANIMVGAFGEVQVMDWGLSKVLLVGGVADEQKSLDKHRDVSVIQTARSVGSDVPQSVGSETRHGSVMGTPAYMPPEQALGRTELVDQRADVFGLGAILAEILTGKPPYVDATGSQILSMASFGKLDDCHQRLDDCSAESELVAICKQSLAPDPSERWRDAGELAAEITSYLEGVQERLKQSELAKVAAETKATEVNRRKKLYLAIAGLLLILACGGALFFKLTADQKQKLADSANQFAMEKDRDAEEQRQLRKDAEEQTLLSNIMRLQGQSQAIASELPMQSTLLAMKGVELARASGMWPNAYVHQCLMQATDRLGGTPIISDPRCSVHSIQITPTDRLVAHVVSGAHELRVFDLNSPDFANPLLLRFDDGGPITTHAVSRDGNTIAATGLDGHLRIWKLSQSGNRELSARDLTGHLAVIALNDEGTKLFSWTETGARVWDLEKLDGTDAGIELRISIAKSKTQSLSPDGRWLITAQQSQNLLDFGKPIWDQESDFDPQAKYVLAATQDSSHQVFSRDGRWLAIGTTLDTRLFDLSAEDVPQSEKIVPGYRGIFSSDSSLLMTGGSLIRLFDLSAQDAPIPRLVLSGESGEFGMAISDDNRWIITASLDKTVRAWDTDSLELDSLPEIIERDGQTTRLWDLRENRSGRTHLLRAHEIWVQQIAFTSDNRRLLTAGIDGNLRQWNMTLGNPGSLTILSGHTERVMSAAISPDNHWAATGAENGIVRLWDLWNDNAFVELLGHEAGVRTLAFTPDSRRLVTANGYVHMKPPTETVARVWDLTSNNPDEAPWELRGHSQGIDFIKIDPLGRRLLTMSRDGTACVWDLSAGPDQKPRVLGGHQGMIVGHAFGLDGKSVFTGTLRSGDPIGGIARYWDLTQPDPIQPKELLKADHWIGIIQVTQKHSFIGESRWQHPTTKLWKLDVDSLAVGAMVELEQMIFTPPSVSRDGRWLGYYDIFDLDSNTPGKPVSFSPNRQGSLNCCTFSEDSAWFVSGGGLDNSARVTHLLADDPESTTIELRGHSADLTCVGFSPDNRWVITGSLDQTARLWELNIDTLMERARQLVGRELTDEELERYQVPRTDS